MFLTASFLHGHVLPGPTFTSCIHDVRRQGPGYSRSVAKDEVHGTIPPNFNSSDGSLKYPLCQSIYRDPSAEYPVYIVEYSDKYIFGMDRYHPVKQPVEHAKVDMGLGENSAGSYNGNGDWAELAVKGSLLVGGIVAADKLFGGASKSPSSSGPQQPSTLPREADYNLFISHAWDYSNEYQRLCSLLNDAEDFSWRNYSVPETDPKEVETDAELTEALVDQIRPASAVVLSAGMYSAYRNWIQKEIRIADEMGKPIIAVKPHGNTQWPRVVENSSAKKVNWNSASVVSAIAEEVDNEDSA